METKIRHASRDYICECCNKVIPADTEYLDTFYETSERKWIHKRYHLECDSSVDVFTRVTKRLEKEGGFIIFDNMGIKAYCVGIDYSIKNAEKRLHLRTWGDYRSFYITKEEAKSWHYDNGDVL